jgi:prolyl-tRNA synthetase
MLVDPNLGVVNPMNQKTTSTSDAKPPAAPVTAVQPTRAEDYALWYQEVIKVSEMAENSAVRGCMVIRPWGYGIWENIQRILDKAFKDTGHTNAYFPLLIPKSFLEKEAEHVAGFAKECAVVTHHRLENDPVNGGLRPAGPLESPYVIRPTSETIIGHSFSKWVSSYRDLPLLINQWANVMRWEMRTRLFLRTSEFLWQEGHTAHETKEEAMAETLQMLDVYSKFCHESLAIPVIKGEKSDSERFPGAVNTFTIEAMMQDGKALQSGTSHFLGQNFAKASEIKFLGRNGDEEFCWTTSWGASTRLIGGLIMTHADDNGMIVPPRVAPVHVVIIPVIHKEVDREKVEKYCQELAVELRAKSYHRHDLQVQIDKRDIRGGEKTWSWIKKGAPIILEVGPRDVDNQAVFMGRRDLLPKEKKGIKREEFVRDVESILDSIQAVLYQRAKDFLQQRTVKIDTEEAFYQFFKGTTEGFCLAHWNGDAAIEKKIKDDLNVTIRCIPLDPDWNDGAGTCPFSGDKSRQRVIFAKSY